MKLNDKVALITGAGSGIGRAIAQLFAEEGARIVANDVNAMAAKETVESLGALGSGARAIQADVADSGQVKAMFAEVDRDLGILDVLVNNAGIAVAAPGDGERLREKSDTRIMEMLSDEGVTTHWDITQEMTDEAWLRMIGVHLNGTFFCTREALRLMSRRNQGAIVNMSSVAGLMGLENVPHYSAAKAGILGFTRAVAREVGSRNIRVNAICPGFIDTPLFRSVVGDLPYRDAIRDQHKLRRFGRPDEIAGAAFFLASEDSSFVNGVALPVDGGYVAGHAYGIAELFT
ncbi:MAG TPA: 3-oxoacyl-ACP reductase family protein [Candidatus Acidoferrales bacterium]|nr:3-oxoacyl-ACP reductase family protein [Candidatus Acidoferrales bacterium]